MKPTDKLKLEAQKENFAEKKVNKISSNSMLADDYPPFPDGTRVITDDNIKGVTVGDYGHKVSVQYDGTNASVVMHKNVISRLIGG